MATLFGEDLVVSTLELLIYKMGGEKEGETRGLFTTVTTLLGYLLLTIVGKVNDVWDNVTGTSKFTEEM